MNPGECGGWPRRVPLRRDDAPEYLVVIDAVPQERPPQHAFGDRAKLAERGVAAAVLHGGARLDAVHAKFLEGKAQHRARARLEQAGAPEARAEREAPFSRRECRIELPHLDDADDLVVSPRHDPEADIASRRLLTARPLDEALEPGDRCRRRRDETRHVRG